MNRQSTTISARVLGVSAVFFATVSSAGEAPKPEATTNAPIVVAASGVSAATASTSVAARADAAFPPAEKGVRNAAAQGPTALRRYVHRTEPIYHYSYRDFARLLPQE